MLPRVGVDAEGTILLEELRAAITPQTVLVAVHHVNHDIGTLQPIPEDGRVCPVKGVPLTVVTDRAIADYEMVGNSASQKAGWAKIIFLKQTGSSEEASISVIDVRTSEVAFAYNYNTFNSYRGKQSGAESCAKHLGWHIRNGRREAAALTPRTDEEIRALRLKYYAESPAGRETARVAAALPVIGEEQAVAVHCSRGRHRSVAMACAILIAMDYSAEAATLIVNEKRPQADPQIWYIRSPILHFEEHWPHGCAAVSETPLNDQRLTAKPLPPF